MGNRVVLYLVLLLGFGCDSDSTNSLGEADSDIETSLDGQVEADAQEADSFLLSRDSGSTRDAGGNPPHVPRGAS